MDRALLSEFDRRIAARGYENRSEALRDLVRADLTRAAWDRGAQVAASITLVYDNQVQGLLTHADRRRRRSLVGRPCASPSPRAAPSRSSP